MIAEFQKQILRLEREINQLTSENAVMRSALENIAENQDPKQTWVFVAVERRLIARRALDQLEEMTKKRD